MKSMYTGALSKPAGFDWPGVAGPQINTRPLVAYRAANGRAELDFAFWSQTSTMFGGKRYFVSKGGSDASAGTEAAPFATLDYALSKSDAREIVIDPDTYIKPWQANPATVVASIIVANGGRATMVYGDVPAAWIYAGVAGVFRAPCAGPVNSVVCRQLVDEFGASLNLTPRGTVAGVIAAAEGWAVDSGNIYIKLPGSLTPNGNFTFVLHSGGGPKITDGARYFIKGLEFFGGAHAFQVSTANAAVFMEECEFNSSAGNGFDANETRAGTVLKNCRAMNNFADGFNYHNYNPATPCYAIEMDCVGLGNGRDNTNGINNGSTNHDNSRIVRFNGVYGAGNGPSVADVGSSQSWNVNCVAYGAAGGTNASFQCGNDPDTPGAKTKMWLDHCVSHGSPWDLYVTTNHELSIRGFDGDGRYYKSGTGWISPY